MLTLDVGAYTISVVIFALVGFSYVVGDISSCLTQPGPEFQGARAKQRPGFPSSF